MKSILVIGIGSFGYYLCRQLVQVGNDVVAIDKREEALERIQDLVENRLIVDGTVPGGLEELDVTNFDVCFVCVGQDFKSNILIVSRLKELGAKYIVSQTNDEDLEKLLLKNGADQTIHPYKDLAIREAMRYSSKGIYDCIQLDSGHTIFEMAPLKQWTNRSLKDAKIRQNYHVNVIAIRTHTGKLIPMPSSDTIIDASDQLLVFANQDDLKTFITK